ncbi:hypothetical protein ACA910_009027 [Epithemia clementina (nom. ined.)]
MSAFFLVLFPCLFLVGQGFTLHQKFPIIVRQLYHASSSLWSPSPSPSLSQQRDNFLLAASTNKHSGEHVTEQSRHDAVTAHNDSNTNNNHHHQTPCSVPRRSAFLSLAAGTAWWATVVTTTTTAAAWAKDVDPSLKGTKKDPAYEACVSECIFYCTKPKGDEQKSRKECLPECKKSCATTKEQLMIGTPINKK